MVIEKAKRLVRTSATVVIMLRFNPSPRGAYNHHRAHAGKRPFRRRDSNALQRPKRFFGRGCNIDEVDRVTIIGHGPRRDRLPHGRSNLREFKGTGNMEIIMGQQAWESVCFPAIAIQRSGTRKEELQNPQGRSAAVWVLRRLLNPLSPV